MAAKKKAGSTRRFGARYGRKVRSKVDMVESLSRAFHKCPYCSTIRAKKVSAGIFVCRKCNSRFTGKAYAPFKKKTIVGALGPASDSGVFESSLFVQDGAAKGSSAKPDEAAQEEQEQKIPKREGKNQDNKTPKKGDEKISAAKSQKPKNSKKAESAEDDSNQEDSRLQKRQ